MHSEQQTGMEVKTTTVWNETLQKTKIKDTFPFA